MTIMRQLRHEVSDETVYESVESVESIEKQGELYNFT